MVKEGLGLELQLGLPGGCPSMEKNGKKRVFSEITVEDENSSNTERKVQNKNEVVGWPPVCSYRKKNNVHEKYESKPSKIYVKVGMDGTPFMRKIDLNTRKGYPDLIFVFQKLFGCSTSGGVLLKDSESSEFIPIYEDKDGDWMLVGDVPWEMFIESCKRLRIMRRSDAKGVQLRSRISEKNYLGNWATIEA
ncbi:hypothetical protein IFM89_004219 [Coptis chinensis]|uniref:Auxin-responsive protein n=1 Tax=Coptis chinensis TaxID=261450 RepID=A0A835I905_9MAGN|nr:hypothetical protein IFM89_004219 [Coptis chinensis]